MKWNDEIRCTLKGDIPVNKIYEVRMAQCLYITKKYHYGELSLMKQENIRMAIKENHDFDKIRLTARTKCGYCFFYNDNCAKCPLEVRGCPDIHSILFLCHDIIKFATEHKAWCKKLELWDKEWEK